MHFILDFNIFYKASLVTSFFYLWSLQMRKDILKLELALQEGMSAKIIDNKIVIEIDKNITQRDLWIGQIEMWLSGKDSIKAISSGYLRVSNKNKLQYKNWR
ncbi:hypothetical protein [Aliarcobacter butzleri]|uniref:hypothetical protein n=2 Tax=Campylobacterales TaxID=213849 RepID=UPI002B24662A|nr:hypothetical protein [Aliarcobacter butzleri]